MRNLLVFMGFLALGGCADSRVTDPEPLECLADTMVEEPTGSGWVEMEPGIATVEIELDPVADTFDRSDRHRLTFEGAPVVAVEATCNDGRGTVAACYVNGERFYGDGPSAGCGVVLEGIRDFDVQCWGGPPVQVRVSFLVSETCEPLQIAHESWAP